MHWTFGPKQPMSLKHASSPANRVQKVWDAAITSAAYTNLLSRSRSETDTVRIAAAAPHSGTGSRLCPLLQ